MKKLIALALSALLLFALLTGCAQKEAEPAAAGPAQPAAEAPAEAPADEEASAAESAEEPAEEPAPAEPALPDGVYTAEFNTDSSMFHANEACDGKGTLTVKDGSMTIHVSLTSKSIVNLFYGLAEDAQKDGAELLQPTTDTVTYSDGLSDEVYGFDIPVPALDTEFDVALIGKKGVWYDHKVSVTDPVPAAEAGKTVQDLGLADGVYTAELTFAGGSGKAQVLSPCTYAYACPSHHNTVTRLKWLTALTVDPETKSQMLHLARKIETETEERWYEAFYHHLRVEMDEYRRIRRSLRALKANTDYEEELYEEAV